MATDQRNRGIKRYANAFKIETDSSDSPNIELNRLFFISEYVYNCMCFPIGPHRHFDDFERNLRHYNGRRMSEEREPHPKKNTAWMEKFKERSLYSDRPNKYVRSHRLGAIHKRLGKKIDSNDDQIDEKCSILMHQSNGQQHESGGRNPFRSTGNPYRSIATVTTPDSMASQSIDDKDPLQMIKVKIERHSPVKSTGHHDKDGDGGRSNSFAGCSNGKRTRDESESESDDVTVIQTPVKRQKTEDASIDLGLYIFGFDQMGNWHQIDVVFNFQMVRSLLTI